MVYLVCKMLDPSGSHYDKRAHFIDEYLWCGNKKFIRTKFLGKGKNGTVYKCHDADDVSNTEYAVKFLHQLTPLKISRFDFENNLLAEIKHPNILKLISSGEVETSLKEFTIPFIITELMDGNLEGLVENLGVLDYATIKKYTKDICEGFNYLHTNGVIHRDIKPSNFLIKNDSIIIGDLGFAKTFTDEGKSRFFRPEITLDQDTVGPQLYMSPELLKYAKNKNTIVDHRSDIFQIGSVIWYLATGFPPTGSITINDDPTQGKLFHLVEKCRMVNPADRYQSAKELYAAME